MINDKSQSEFQIGGDCPSSAMEFVPMIWGFWGQQMPRSDFLQLFDQWSLFCVIGVSVFKS